MTAGGGQPRPVRRRPAAVLDTSAWVAAHRAQVAANLFDLFMLLVPEAVADEIAARHPAFPSWEFPHATLFRILRPRMRILGADEVTPLPIPGPGEAAALAVAQARRALVLVNEWRAVEYATDLGLQTITIPTVIVRLHLAGVMSRAAAEAKLSAISNMTTRSYIDEAQRLIHAAQLP